MWKKIGLYVLVGLGAIFLSRKVSAVSSLIDKIPGFSA